MPYEEFERIIEELKKNNEYIDKLASLNVNIFENLTLETMVVDLLARILGDENDWLSWWIWEKDFGARTELNAFDGDNVIPTDTAQDIYNLILRSKEEEKK